MTDDLLARHRAVHAGLDAAATTTSRSRSSPALGRRVTDAQGRTYLDFFGGVLTNMIGYDIAEIGDAVRGSSTPASCTPRRCT